MAVVERGPGVNLEDLRGELAGRPAAMLVVVSYVAIALVMMPVLRRHPYPLKEIGLLVAVAGLSVGVRVLVDVRENSL